MNILVVHAHENPDSFCSSLAKTVQTWSEQNGHHFTISDLYQKEFNPVAGKHDFVQLSDSDYYKYAIEQLNAHLNQLFAPEVKTEMGLVDKADVLIFNFPLWWFGLPAILKGWVDKILAYGFAYGGENGIYKNGAFQNRKAFICITTGSPETMYTQQGIHERELSDILRNMQEGILGLVGFEVLPPFVAYSVSSISNENRTQIIEDYKKYLDQHLK